MWSWNKEKIILSSQNSIPADLAVKQTHFMNWNAEESLLTTTANVNMTLQAVPACICRADYLEANVKTLAIIQSERNWNRKGSKYRYTLTA